MGRSRDIPDAVRYTVFKTRWGYFGLAGTDMGLLRSCLPVARPEEVESLLLSDMACARGEKGLFKNLQEQITAYFEGGHVVFNNDIPIVHEGTSGFARKVLTALRGVGFGQTISYGQLARKAGRANSARAVGRVMAGNRLPLIIPCHRVVCSDGRLGGFSAVGGVSVKKRMLEMEKAVGGGDQRIRGSG
jgi:methylated-DNA-[protein]-cysteine S-methyltransferase